MDVFWLLEAFSLITWILSAATLRRLETLRRNNPLFSSPVSERRSASVSPPPSLPLPLLRVSLSLSLSVCMQLQLRCFTCVCVCVFQDLRDVVLAARRAALVPGRLPAVLPGAAARPAPRRSQQQNVSRGGGSGRG